LTTIISIRCKDGIVVGADTQATEATTWEYSIKVKEIDRFSLMAFAGTANYVELFAKYVRKSVSKRGTSDYYDAINSAIESYSVDIGKRIKRVELSPELISSCYPEAAFATNDLSSNNYRLFEVKTPHPCSEPEYPFRVTVGSGGRTAVAFLKNIENLMMKFGLNWNLVSTNLASQLCWLLLNRVELVDPGSSGAILYRIDDSETHRLTGRDVWGEQEHESWSTVALRTAIDEIPQEKLEQIVQRYKLADVFKKIVATFVDA
jgi:hypothetical protein